MKDAGNISLFEALKMKMWRGNGNGYSLEIGLELVDWLKWSQNGDKIQIANRRVAFSKFISQSNFNETKRSFRNLS
jgi:hypothetical protein